MYKNKKATGAEKWLCDYVSEVVDFDMSDSDILLGSYCSTTELYPQYALPIYYITNHQKGQEKSTQGTQKNIFQKHEEYCIQNTKR